MLVRQKDLAMETHLSVCHSQVQWIFSSFHFYSYVFGLYHFLDLYRHTFISEIQTECLWCDVKRILFLN